MADLAGVLKQLEQERGRIDQAIRAIGGLVGRNGGGCPEFETPEADAIGGRAQENFTRTKGTMGEDKADGGTDESAHDEPSWTQ